MSVTEVPVVAPVVAPAEVTDPDMLAVERAALILDEHHPGWWRSIDPETFNLLRPCLCISGQMGLKEPLAWMNLARLVGDDGGMFSDHERFGAMWLDEVAARNARQ